MLDAPAIDDGHSRDEGMLDGIVRRLREAEPEQFGQILETAYKNRIYDALGRGTLDMDRVRDAISLAANGRASCWLIVEEFVSRYMPAPRTLFQAMADLGYSDGGYVPGDEPDELIKNMLPRDGVTMIGGQSGAGKTFILVDMALSLATQRPFMGHSVRERVGVIIAAAEGAGTIKARIEAAKRHAGVDGDVAIVLLSRVPDLKGVEQMEAFGKDVAMIAKHMRNKYGVRVGMLGIDTITAAFSIEDENSNSEAAMVCKHLAALAAFLDMAVVPVHHFGKSAEQGLRGASAWRANVDHGLSILAERSNATGKVERRSINAMKSRIGEEGPVCDFELVGITLGQSKYNEPIITCAVDRVEAKDEPASGGKKRPSTAANLAFNDAWHECALATEKRRRVHGDGPSVPAVLVESVRAEFSRRYSVDGSTKKNRDDALRNAWTRAKEAALVSRDYATENATGEAWIWSTRAERNP